MHPDLAGYKAVQSLVEEGIEVVCGGFPCQDISIAGSGAELSGERSGLWREMLRTIRLVRPKYAFVENVAALLHRGMGTVLGDLAESGYDTEWNCISAADVGAPHLRERMWIVAHPQREGLPRPLLHWEGICQPERATPAQFGNRVVSCGVRWLDDFGNLLLGDAVPMRVGRHSIKAYGNAVVPQIPELIGRAITGPAVRYS